MSTNIDIEKVAADLVAAADATRPVEGQGAHDGNDAPWAGPARQVAAALLTLHERLLALETAPMAQAAKRRT